MKFLQNCAKRHTKTVEIEAIRYDLMQIAYFRQVFQQKSSFTQKFSMQIKKRTKNTIKKYNTKRKREIDFVKITII